MTPNTYTVKCKTLLLSAATKSVWMSYREKSKIQRFGAQNTYSFICYLCNKLGYKYPELRSHKRIGNVMTSGMQISGFSRSFCTAVAPKKAGIFGDLSNMKYERTEMDADEQAEERFSEKEVRPPQWKNLRPSEYANLIKDYLKKGDLNSARSVLDLVNENRDKPTSYLYTLLIYGYSQQGYYSECFKLYNDMKKRGLKPTLGIYTSLFVACAMSKNEKSLIMLRKLKDELDRKQIQLNATHYNALIKAYGSCRQTEDAFQLIHEMKEKNVKPSNESYVELLYSSLSDKKEGIQRALFIWNLMRINGVTPNASHYVALFHVVKKCGIQSLNINDTLLPGDESTQLQLIDHGRPNLLAVPPVMSKMYLPTEYTEKQLEKKFDDTSGDHITIDWISILKKNALLLFGGFDNVVKQMKKDGVDPNIRILTALIALIPNTNTAEEEVLEYIRKNKLIPDVAFYNTLMSRKVARGDVESAKSIISKMEEYNIKPNIVTFNILATGCKTRKTGWELINGLEAMGYMPNKSILESLIVNASKNYNFQYTMDMLNYARKNKIKLTDETFARLHNFNKEIQELLQRKYPSAKLRDLRSKYNVFKLQYDEWLEATQNYYETK